MLFENCDLAGERASRIPSLAPGATSCTSCSIARPSSVPVARREVLPSDDDVRREIAASPRRRPRWAGRRRAEAKLSDRTPTFVPVPSMPRACAEIRLLHGDRLALHASRQACDGRCTASTRSTPGTAAAARADDERQIAFDERRVHLADGRDAQAGRHEPPQSVGGVADGSSRTCTSGSPIAFDDDECASPRRASDCRSRTA